MKPIKFFLNISCADIRRPLTLLLAASLLCNSISALGMFNDDVSEQKTNELIEIKNIQDSYGQLAGVPDEVITHGILSFADIKTIKNISWVNKTWKHLFDKSLDTSLQDITQDLINAVDDAGKLLEDSNFAQVIKQLKENIERDGAVHIKIGTVIKKPTKNNFLYCVYEIAKAAIQEYKEECEKILDQEENSCLIKCVTTAPLPVLFIAIWTIACFVGLLLGITMYSWGGSNRIDIYIIGIIVTIFGCIISCFLGDSIIAWSLIKADCSVEKIRRDTWFKRLMYAIWVPGLRARRNLGKKVYECFLKKSFKGIDEKCKKIEQVEKNLGEIIFGIKPTKKMKNILEKIEMLDVEEMRIMKAYIDKAEAKVGQCATSFIQVRERARQEFDALVRNLRCSQVQDMQEIVDEGCTLLRDHEQEEKEFFKSGHQFSKKMDEVVKTLLKLQKQMLLKELNYEIEKEKLLQCTQVLPFEVVVQK